MSFGALSYEAKVALARGATMAGTATCSGEGGMLPDERRYSEKWFYQCIQSRYGFNPHHLRLADAVEVFIGQGCKVGLGGHLMGQKVTDQVAEMRSLPAGIDQRSPARHPDWLGPDDLAFKMEELREATNHEIPIQLKLGSARVFDDVRMAAKTGPDSIYIDGWKARPVPARTSLPRRRVFRASPQSAQAGRPSTRWVRRARFRWSTPGGIRNGADVAKALALGADAVAIGTAALVALNCNKDIPESGLRGDDRRPGRLLLPLPYGSLPRRRDDPGSRIAQAAQPGRRGRASLQLPPYPYDGVPDAGACLRQD